MIDTLLARLGIVLALPVTLVLAIAWRDLPGWWRDVKEAWNDGPTFMD